MQLQLVGMKVPNRVIIIIIIIIYILFYLHNLLICYIIIIIIIIIPIWGLSSPTTHLVWEKSWWEGGDVGKQFGAM
jgi:hypothetical protein